MTKETVKTEELENGTPVCEKCGNIMIKEQEAWVCPHCQGEIDFLGDEDE